MVQMGYGSVQLAVFEGTPLRHLDALVRHSDASRLIEERDAEIERLRSDAERLRAALRRILRSIPTDSDMSDAGWESCEINEACDAYDQARAALKETP